jgi:hypothetical protein
MQRSRLIAGVFLAAVGSVAHAQAPPPTQAQDAVRDVRVIGAKELPASEVVSAARVRIGEPLAARPDDLAHAVEQHYRDGGYSFATAQAAFDEPSGTLTLTIDEGVIDRVEFVGIGRSLAQTFVDEFALRGGDVFNRARALEALEVLLRPTRGAVRPARVAVATATEITGHTEATPLGVFGGTSSSDRDEGRDLRNPFDRVDRNGERVLRVGLAQPPGRYRFAPGDREDWFTPVDGLVPSVAFGGALFDHDRFNHAYVAGHLSYKMASHHAGYAIGVEKPFFGSTKLFIGGEAYRLTATEDNWRVSSAEATLGAIGPRRSLRDYYQRRGVQIGGALRLHQQVELLFAWRGEQHESLSTITEFSVWNNDEAFRPNLTAHTGRLDSIVIGGVANSAGFERESLETTYQRHRLEGPFGATLPDPADDEVQPAWRFDWTSEIASPDRLGGDFDFTRHVVSGRARFPLSPHQEIAARGIVGWSGGILPPQRQFAIGGIGTVHGYEFKEAVGDTLSLANLEYALGGKGMPRLLAFFDVGRVASRFSADARWLRGAGFGFGFGSLRLDFGYPLESGRSAPRILLRLVRNF